MNKKNGEREAIKVSTSRTVQGIWGDFPGVTKTGEFMGGKVTPRSKTGREEQGTENSGLSWGSGVNTHSALGLCQEPGYRNSLNLLTLSCEVSINKPILTARRIS